MSQKHVIKSPCFDPATKTDCADRCQGCATACKKWAEYVVARDAAYKKSAMDAMAKSDYIYVRGRSFDKSRRGRE